MRQHIGRTCSKALQAPSARRVLLYEGIAATFSAGVSRVNFRISPTGTPVQTL
jgi:hypothetical protein